MLILPPPSWFKLDEYLQGPDPRKNPRTGKAWLEALSIRRQCNHMLSWKSEPDPEEEAPPLPPEAVKVDPQAIWQNLWTPLGYPPVPALLPPVQDITNRYEDVVGECLVRINLAAPDRLIFFELRRLLAKKRQSWPDAYPGCGRPAKQPTLDAKAILKALLHTWTAYRILALSDLQLWHILEGRKPILMQLGTWIYPNTPANTDPKERPREARRTLERALIDGIDCLTALV